MMSSGLRVLAAIAVVSGLSACSGGVSDFSPTSMLRDPVKEQESIERYAAVAVCPEIQVRDGTQLLRVFERGKDGDMSAVRFQGTVQKFARECKTDRLTGATTVKVGVAGRLLSGPSGATGGHTLPLRIVLVKNGDEVLYSQLHPVDAAIPAGQAAVTWTKVVDGITIQPGPEGRYVLYVGFDEGTGPGA
jgi:hypothetical protein